jgi:hypothetical protein
MLGRLLFACTLAMAVGCLYPLVNEHANSPCQALEQRVVTLEGPGTPRRHPGSAFGWALARAYIEPLSAGTVAAAAIKERYPALPPQVGCALGYWTTLLDPAARQHVLDAIL